MSSITCEPKLLAAALAAVKPAASKYSAIEALSGVLINSYDRQNPAERGVYLRCTNMETHILRRIDAEVNGSLQLVAPLKLLVDAVKLFAKYEQVTLAQVEHELVLSAGARTIKLNTLRLEDFAPMPPQGGRMLFTANGGELAKLVERANRFVSKDETRPVLTGMNFDWRDGNVLAVATDSYRLGVFAVACERIVDVSKDPDRNGANIPGASLGMVAKLAKNAPSVTVLASDQWAILEWPDHVVAARLIDGQYPRWRQLMPERFYHEVTVPAVALAEACTMATKFCHKNAPVRFWANGTVKLYGHTPDVGGFEEVLEGATANLHHAQVTADGTFEIGLNPSFLADIAQNYQADTVVLRAISPLRPALFEDGDDRYLLMPIRLNV